MSHSHVAGDNNRWMFRFERGLCPRHERGEVSEGAIEAPSEETRRMGPYRRAGGKNAKHLLELNR